MKKSTKILVVSLLMTMIFSLTASANVTVTFWKAPHGEDEAIFGELIRRFEAENPGIKIDHLATPWQGWDEQYGAAFAGGNPPDISYMPDEFYPRFAESGNLLALSDYWPEEISESSNAYPEGTWSKGTYKGKQYGIPTLSAPFLTFVNTDLMEVAGVDAPTTWDEFKQAVIDLGSVTTYGWAITTRANDNPQNAWYSFLFQAGGDLLNEDGTAVGWNNEAGVLALEFVTDLMMLDETPMPGAFNNDQLDDLFLSGELAMRTAGPDFVALIARENPDLQYDILEPVEGPAGNSLVWTPTGNWVISESSKNKEEAWRFVKFLVDNEEYYASRLMMLPSQSGINAFPDIPEMEIYLRIDDDFYPTPIHPQLRLTHSYLNSEIEAAFFGIKTPEQAIRDAANRIDRILAQ